MYKVQRLYLVTQKASDLGMYERRDAALADELGRLVVDIARVLRKRLAAALNEGFNLVQTAFDVLLKFADLHG